MTLGVEVDHTPGAATATGVRRRRQPLGAGLSGSARTALVLGPALLMIVAAYWFGNTDPDYWWHVRTGQVIWETRALPTVDPFSYTGPHDPWVTHEWLTQLVFWLVQSTAGYAGLVALFGALGALTGLCVYLTCRLWGAGELTSVIGMLVAIMVGVGSTASVRPQVTTMLLLAVTAYLLTRYRQGDRRALWWIPPLLALWVNLHGGYVIGLALLGATLVGEWGSRLAGRSAAPWRPLLLTCLLAGFATLINPHGIEAWKYPFTYAGSGNASMLYIAEWQSPNFHAPYFFVLAGLILSLMIVGVGRAPIGLTGTIWCLAFTFLALRSVRHIPLFGVIIVPLLLARLTHELPALGRSILRWRRPALLFIVPPAVVVGLMVMAGGAERLGLRPQVGFEPHANSYPAEAVAYLKARPAGEPGRIFNDYGWGGYLIYQFYPEPRIFIDGRADVYGDTFMERYADVLRLKPGWQSTLDEFDVRWAVLPHDSALAHNLAADPAWEEVLTGRVERLFHRRGGERGQEG